MKERPILFSAEMVRAILDGRKTQTRRVVKPPRQWPEYWHCDPFAMPPAVWWWNGEHDRVGVRRECPYGQPGDRLWVRETWGLSGTEATTRLRDFHDPEEMLREHLIHRATADGYDMEVQHWRPSIHMPRWACRILLEVVSVRVERLQEISQEDAQAEGCRNPDLPAGITGVAGDYVADERTSLAILWNRINGPGSWAANPWVWVVEFKRIDQEAP